MPQSQKKWFFLNNKIHIQCDHLKTFCVITSNQVDLFEFNFQQKIATVIAFPKVA